ncbi:MAG TPA: signal peptidase I [Verrucomicrobiae bacterium]|nr:signal peptidase I [Verrucomicrobiae bacterium]
MAKSVKGGTSSPSDRPSAVSPTPAPSDFVPGKRPRSPSFFYLLTSGPARHTRSLCKHVRKILNHQRDILSPAAVHEVEAAHYSACEALANKAGKEALRKESENLEAAANKWLRPYPNAAWRENVEVLLVALTVAMGVRTFFLQPFKIPTGSMQPTLFGVTSENLSPEFDIPGGANRVLEWFKGNSYVHLVAPHDGQFLGADQPVGLPIFKIYQKIYFTGKTMTLWFPPDYGSELLAPTYSGVGPAMQVRSTLQRGQFFRKGETMVKLRVSAGDHLFVDRLSYNFKAPERGEIIVFETHGIDRLNQLMPTQGDTFYIKRLAGLGGEELAIEPDYQLQLPRRSLDELHPTVAIGHLVVNGEPLSASTPHFANLYSFSGATRHSKSIDYRKDQYLGHAAIGNLEPGSHFTVQTNHLYVLGDNTMNSSDSRFWGDFPKEKLIGKSFFVYWPITRRFGWGSSY